MTDTPATGLTRFKRPLLYLMAPIYVVAGLFHFLNPKPFVAIVPEELPSPLGLVYLSGLAEIVLGVGLLSPRTRQLSAKGLVLLLAAVFPANVDMAVRGQGTEGLPDHPAVDAALWLRLPLQGVLMAWAWWYSTPLPDESA
jgi:uncharacterized membrane protein